jgi:hypothetical protein
MRIKGYLEGWSTTNGRGQSLWESLEGSDSEGADI